MTDLQSFILGIKSQGLKYTILVENYTTTVEVIRNGSVVLRQKFDDQEKMVW